MCRKSPWGSKKEVAFLATLLYWPHNKCTHTPTCNGIPLSKNLHMHVGEGLRNSQVWKKKKRKKGNLPKVNKDLEGLSSISDLNHLFTALLPHTLFFFLGVYFYLAPVLNKQTVFLPWSPIVSRWISNNKLLSEMKSLSPVQLFETLWSVAHQAPLSMGFSRQEYWSGLPFPSPGYLPNSGIEPVSSTFQADTLTSEPPEKPNKFCIYSQSFCLL